MPIKERDIVLQGRDGGQDTIDLPITRLGNVESGAEVKEAPAQGDYIPIIDGADSEQMKKFPATVLTDAVETADRALKAVQRVAYVIDTLPYQTMALTFTGEEQSPVWGAFDPEKLEISGDVSAVNAGEYEAVFTPKGDYVWADESVEPRTVKWTIGRAPVEIMPSQSGSLVYTGTALSPVWSNYDGEKLELGGDTSGVNAGNYTASFTPKTNYQWSDGTTGAKTVGWSIGRAVVAVPSQSGSRTYNGQAQSPTWSNYDANKLTIGGTTSGTNAGSYSATFTPKANYQWSDGSTTAKTVSWSIGKATGSLTLNKNSLGLSLQTPGEINVTKAGDGAISAKSGNAGIATVFVSGNIIRVTGVSSGSVTITVSVAAGTNHSAAVDQTCVAYVTAQAGNIVKLHITCGGENAKAGIPITGATKLDGSELATDGTAALLACVSGTSVKLTTPAYLDMAAGSISANVSSNSITDINWVLPVPAGGTKEFATTTTFTFSPYATTMDVCCVGGGGGGGGGNYLSSGYGNYAGSGGGGGYVQNVMNRAITALTAYMCVIGAGGLGGAGGSSQNYSGEVGGDGGATSVTLGSQVVASAQGGKGGGNGTSSATGGAGNGAGGKGGTLNTQGGAGTTGTVRVFGEDTGKLFSGGGGGGGGPAAGNAPGGGGSPYGGKGAQRAYNRDNDGKGPGGGGGGGSKHYSGEFPCVGGTGYDGIMVIRWRVSV